MIREGFSTIHEYDDSPNEEFPEHDHPEDHLLVVAKGSIFIQMDGKTSLLKEDDRMFFPAQKLHSAKIGPEGCLYFDGARS